MGSRVRGGACLGGLHLDGGAREGRGREGRGGEAERGGGEREHQQQVQQPAARGGDACGLGGHSRRHPCAARKATARSRGGTKGGLRRGGCVRASVREMHRTEGSTISKVNTRRYNLPFCYYTNLFSYFSTRRNCSIFSFVAGSLTRGAERGAARAEDPNPNPIPQIPSLEAPKSASAIASPPDQRPCPAHRHPLPSRPLPCPRSAAASALAASARPCHIFARCLGSCACPGSTYSSCGRC